MARLDPPGGRPAESTVRILIVEDEPRIASLLEEGLQAEGYATVVARDGEEGIARGADPEVELVILDVMLPKLDGYGVLAALRRQRPEVPVIMLTARGDTDSKVGGLDAGADDYLTKPFAFEELLARLRALSRRRSQGWMLAGGGLVLDLRTRVVRVGERAVDLTDREFALLEFFIRHPGELVSRRDLLREVWQLDFDPQSTVLETTLTRLRQKLARAGGRLPVQTVRGAGYRFSDRG